MILSICICSLTKRLPTLSRLMDNLQTQADLFPGQVEILVESDSGEMPTGKKRNILYNKAQGKYVVSVDDDDTVPVWYVEKILKAVETSPDSVAINGWMSTDGKNIEQWSISIFHAYMTVKKMGRNYYLRPPNHITPMLREIAIQYPFPELYIGEDHAFCMALQNANALKTEIAIAEPLYEYKYNSKK